MKTLDQVISGVLEREGWPKVTNRASDRGGLTKGGVTISSFNTWRVGHRERALQPNEFVLITEDDARAFYEDEFCRPLRFIGDEGVFVFLSDWAVTSGVDDPTKALQAELAELGLYTGAIDGVPGPKTRAAWQTIRRDLVAVSALEVELIRRRALFYVDVGLDREVRAFMQAHPTCQLWNLRGWLSRTLEFLS